MYSTPPTAQTTGAIESIFWLEVHQADIYSQYEYSHETFS